MIIETWFTNQQCRNFAPAHNLFRNSWLKAEENSFCSHSLILILKIQSGHNFAHMTAKLLWYICKIVTWSDRYISRLTNICASFQSKAHIPFVEWAPDHFGSTTYTVFHTFIKYILEAANINPLYLRNKTAVPGRCIFSRKKACNQTNIHLTNNMTAIKLNEKIKFSLR